MPRARLLAALKQLAHDLSAARSSVSAAINRHRCVDRRALAFRAAAHREPPWHAGEFRVVFNTVPHQVLTTGALAELPPDCLLIELMARVAILTRSKRCAFRISKAWGSVWRVAPDGGAQQKRTLCRSSSEGRSNTIDWFRACCSATIPELLKPYDRHLRRA